jgi:NADH-quinone oxidoreductase subunit J
MVLEAAFFYLFASITVLAALCVIVARNPVHAVLFLILTFFSAAGLFVLLGAEFIAMTLVIVYVGAVAVLFLFVVMMLDVDFAELRAGAVKNMPIGLLVGLGLLVELVAVLAWVRVGDKAAILQKAAAPTPTGVSNTKALGRVLYTDFAYVFEVAGLILLVAMIGAIVLTLKHKEGVKRQSIAAQNARTPQTAMQVVKVKPGEAMLPPRSREKADA